MARHPTSNEADPTAKQDLDEGAKAGERAAATAESTAAAGFRTVSDAADRSAGQVRQGMEQLSAQGEAAVRHSQKSIEAAAQAGGVLMQGSQEISQAWLNLAQDRIERMAEGMRALAACRTPADLINAQSVLLQRAMEQMIDTNRRVADVSMRVMQEVTANASALRKGRGR